MPSSLPAAPSPETAISLNSPMPISRGLWRFFVDLIAALTNRTPVVGSVTFAAATTAAVTFTTAEGNANYNIWPAAPDTKVYWASSKTTTGFTMNASGVHTGAVAYQLIRA